MDHESICDCRFLEQCETFADSLIGRDRKGAGGFGCYGQDDVYRSKHCRTFTCSYLCMVLTDAAHQPMPGG